MSIDKSKLESRSLFISMFFIGHHLSGQPWRAHPSCGLTGGHVRSAPNMDFQHETFVSTSYIRNKENVSLSTLLVRFVILFD